MISDTLVTSKEASADPSGLRPDRRGLLASSKLCLLRACSDSGEALLYMLFFLSKSSKIWSRGGSEVSKRGLRETLAARPLPRPPLEAILRPSWGPSWEPKFYFFVEKKFKRPSGRLRGRFLGGPKKCLKIESSWKRFLIDFWSISGAPGGAKMWSIPRSLTKFWVLAHLKLSYLLRP